MDSLLQDKVRQTVRDRYRKVALQADTEKNESGGCCGSTSGCCGTANDVQHISAQLGYSDVELSVVPEGANLGLGCGNPQAIAALQPGEVVVDLGSGAGFDCFLAARRVGEMGRVIGVDMTPEMISRARNNAISGNYQNAEFRLGEIEHLPVANATVDVILSNCVINLSPDKPAVFQEALRVLKPGGRLAISDVVTTAEFPPAIQQDLGDFYSACVSGASSIQELHALLAASGFTDVSIELKEETKEVLKDWVPGAHVDDYIASATIQARKP
ncbi:methyltransferase domain-containing protein [Alicyclobacillaceae bacterium I2511]|nr:methyltransferase domain-containing protein [Alicyclobacillaceae bacterium I2511]